MVIAATASAGVATQPQRPPGQLQPLPLTQLDDRSAAPELDNRLLTLTFPQPIPVRDLLLLLVRGTALSIAPDAGVAGSFSGELRNVTIRQALGLTLPALGLDYAIEGSFIRVFQRERQTRLFPIHVIAAQRAGAATVGDSAQVTTTTATDLFGDLAAGVRALLSENAAFNVDRKAGLLQVTDFPERLDRVARYLAAVHDRVLRQVHIDARVVEVELTDPAAQGLDWTALTGATVDAGRGIRVTDLPQFMGRLAAQGIVATLASPQLRVMNNEPAVVRAVAQSAPGNGSPSAEHGISLGVTPHISADGLITLSLTPVVKVHTPDAERRTSGVISTNETDTLARVRDGETIVLAGFFREREVREPRTGRSGGWFGRSTTITRRRVELVILLTPRILS